MVSELKDVLLSQYIVLMFGNKFIAIWGCVGLLTLFRLIHI